MTSWTSAPDSADDAPFDITVIVPTILRRTLLAAVRSIFMQDFTGRVQILIGIDRVDGDRSMLDNIRYECPANMAVTVCDLGYSLARSYGDMNISRQGGTMRAGLSFLAAARYIAYLDDDNWWAPEHLSSLREAIEGHGYAWSQRWMVRGSDDVPVVVDEWISVGPGLGLFARISGGLVDTSCMLLDRARCPEILWRWAHAAQENGAGDDRLVFRALSRKDTGAGTGKPTVYYRYDPAREQAVKGMMALPVLRPPPTTPVTLAGLRTILDPPEPPPAPGEFRRPRRRPPPVAPTPASEALRRVLERRRPTSIVDLHSGDGQRALNLVAAARANELQPSILAVDLWLPNPGDDSERGKFAMHRHGIAHERFLKSVEERVASDLLWSLVACPIEIAGVLLQLGLKVDVVTLSFERQDAAALLRAWWPLLQDNGAFFGPATRGLTRFLKSELDRLIEGRGGELRLLGTEGNTHIMVTRRRRRSDSVAADQ